MIRVRALPGWLSRCAMTMLLVAGWRISLAAPLEFDVPAGPAAQGVTRFAQQAGVSLLFPYELLDRRRTQALRGRFELREGLRTLLKGSGLAAVADEKGQISLQRLNAVPVVREHRREPGPDLLSVDADDAQRRLEELAITGSRLERDGMMMPTPVAVITKVELDTLGPTTLVDAFVQLPHFLNNDTPQTQSFGSSGAAGASYLNLRGIGSVRTLVLLDGRRIVPSTRAGTVDIALLPRSLVRSVEIVTGGASAAYGSDAVSGVVNLILDRDFSGLHGSVQTGLSNRGDYGNRELSLSYGAALGETATLLVAAEVASAQGIRGYRSRDWFHSVAAIENPDPAGTREVFARDVHATGYTYGGLITAGPLAGTQFLPGGVPAPFERGTLVTAQTQGGGSGVDPAADLVWILPDQQRANGFLRVTTRPAENLTAFLQVIGARSSSAFGKDPPSLWGPWEATILQDNAFLSDSIRSRMLDSGIGSFRLGRVSTGDLGKPQVRNASTLVSPTLGVAWQGPTWRLDAYYQYGHNRSALQYSETLRIDRIYRAIDSVRDPASGRIVCRSTLLTPDDGCVPANLFGEGSVSEAARRYVTEGRSAQTQTVQEHVTESTLQGSLFALPAGTVQVVAGAAWRDEAVRVGATRTPDSLDGLIVEPAASLGYRGLPATYAGTPNIFERTTVTEVQGRYAVWELFGETVVPLLALRPLVKNLEVHAALRRAHYSGSGGILAWKTGLNWEVTDALRLRATRSRDVRAGSLAERYDVSNSGVTIVDRVLPASPSYAVTALRTGNPQIDPEKADTTTVGLVLQPDWVPGLSLAADYYDIRIRDAISVLGVQNIINRCAAVQDETCGLIDRNGVTGLITRVQNRVLNVAEARSRGIDVEAAWRRPVTIFGGGESMALRLFGNHTLESSSTSLTGPRIDRAGQTGLGGGAPRWQSNLSLAYQRGPLQFTVQERLVSSGRYSATYGPTSLDDNRIRSASYTNLRVGWEPARWAGMTLFATVSNLFDESPPRAGDWGFVGSLPTNESLFDVLGRRFVAGIQLRR